MINRRKRLDSLGQTQLCLLKKAQTAARERSSGIDFLSGFGKSVRPSTRDSDICRGILPCLSYIVESQTEVSYLAETGCRSGYEGGDVGMRYEGKTSLCCFSDAAARPDTSPTDPYGNEGFNCVYCRQELPNVYFHCNGCESLEKDFNLCEKCFSEGYFAIDFDPRAKCGTHMLSNLCHTGRVTGGKKTKLCRNVQGAIECPTCKLCTHCACKCHNSFSCRQRFYSSAQMSEILKRCKTGGGAKLDFFETTKCQLIAAGASLRESLAAKKHALSALANQRGIVETQKEYWL